MKKIFLLGIIVSVLSACQKDNDDPAPGERPDERLNKVLTEYKTQLVGAPFGWKAVLYPEGGSAYNFLLSFSANDRVTMLSDINASTAAEPFESSYRLKALQQPALLFDTYSYLHILADPDATRSGGEWGQGKLSDFEFSFDSVTSDRIELTGNLNGSKLVLVKATQEDAGNYIQNIAANAKAFENINNFTTYFKRLTVGDHVVDVSVLTGTRKITFSYYEGDVLSTFSTSYYFTEDGVTLLDPFEIDGLTLTSFGAVQYDEASRKINVTVNGNSASIEEATTPISIDLQAARRFYASPPNGVYWLTFEGFTVEGIRDAFNIRSISNFDAILFYIKAANPNDGFIFFTVDGTYFGPALLTQFTNDGRIVFTHVEEFSNPPVKEFGTTPEQALPMVTATRDQMVISEGYYVVQTGPDSYDLVSAKDAKAWISFN